MTNKTLVGVTAAVVIVVGVSSVFWTANDNAYAVHEDTVYYYENIDYTPPGGGNGYNLTFTIDRHGNKCIDWVIDVSSGHANLEEYSFNGGSVDTEYGWTQCGASAEEEISFQVETDGTGEKTCSVSIKFDEDGDEVFDAGEEEFHVMFIYLLDS
jgi:hypothetical protein